MAYRPTRAAASDAPRGSSTHDVINVVGVNGDNMPVMHHPPLGRLAATHA
jgi:hypothetical protein